MIRSIALAAVVALVHLAFADASADEVGLRATLQSRFPDVEIRSISAASLAGWYEVVTPTELVYTNPDGSLLFAGRLIDTATKDDLTERRWNAINAAEFERLPFEAALKVVRGNGSRRIVVFSDPHCPYCRRLETELAGLSNVTIYTFLYPLEDLHPGATETARRIWCSGDRVAAWDAWMRAKTAPVNGTCEGDPVGSIVALGTRLRIDATPTLLLEDGRRLAGALARDVLEIEIGMATNLARSPQAATW